MRLQKMSDIRLDPATGDLNIVNNALLLTTDDNDALAQSLTIRLKFFKREWKYNPDEGIDFYGQVFIKGQGEAIIDGIFQKRILDTLGVQSILNYESIFDSASRQATLNFTVQRNQGVPLTLSISGVPV